MAEEKPKRKYMKQTKMLLRSNNDYIDHGYYQRELEKSKGRHKRMMEKYGMPPLDKLKNQSN
jgi:hypothetical protein